MFRLNLALMSMQQNCNSYKHFFSTRTIQFYKMFGKILGGCIVKKNVERIRPFMAQDSDT